MYAAENDNGRGGDWVAFIVLSWFALHRYLPRVYDMLRKVFLGSLPMKLEYVHRC